MSKKYQIINLNTDLNNTSECAIFYLLYIVLFFVIVFIIYKIIFYCEKKEGFKNENVEPIGKTNLKPIETDLDLKSRIPSPNMNMEKPSIKTPMQIMEDLKQKNQELSTMKETLQDKLLEQSQAIYLSQNYNRVDPSSFNNQLTYLLVDFADTKFPELDMEEKKLIDTQTELDTVLSKANEMKNFYRPGEIVEADSTFNITKNDICYRQNNKPIKPTPEFIAKYPNCMVCEIENDDNLMNTNGWKNTKTNISKVCLYDPKSKPKSGIPNLEQCKSFCNVKN